MSIVPVGQNSSWRSHLSQSFEEGEEMLKLINKLLCKLFAHKFELMGTPEIDFNSHELCTRCGERFYNVQ
ncbi:MAG: DUF1660 family phage protein [Candidatus Thorarchaeota archaeon]